MVRAAGQRGMVKKSYSPHQGDVVWVDFNPAKGREQAKVRPAIIVSPKSYNRKTSLAILCPIASIEKGYPFEVRIAGKKCRELYFLIMFAR